MSTRLDIPEGRRRARTAARTRHPGIAVGTSRTAGGGPSSTAAACRARRPPNASGTSWKSSLMTGTYQVHTKKLWDEFVTEYERRVLDGLAVRTRVESLQSLAQFKRIVKPVRIFAVSTGTIDDFIAARRQEPGRKEVLLSPATLNKDLRHIKAALGMAVEWGYLPRLPRFHRQKEHDQLPTFIQPDDFAAIYQACPAVCRWPDDQPYPAADSWQALLMTAYLTGWRIGQLLGIKRVDVDLAEGFLTTRAGVEGNKGKRDQKIPLHPIVTEHLQKLAGFSPVLFPWPHAVRDLYREFERLQEAAAIQPPEGRQRYGFHDLRRAFATMNADKLFGRRLAGPHAAQELHHHTEVHQHDAAVEASSGGAVRAGREGEAGEIAPRKRLWNLYGT